MANGNRPERPLPRRQTTDRGRVSGRAATRGSSVRFGALSGAITKKSKEDDSKPDIKGKLIERDQTRNQALSNSITAALNDSVSLVKEQNGLLAQIINELRGAAVPTSQTGGGPGGIGDIDVDIDRDKRGRGRGQRGRFGARGRERLQRLREFRAARGSAPRPTASAPRSVGSAMRTVGQTFTRIAPSLGAAAAPALAAAAAGASLGIIGTAAYRAATMSPEERESIRQRAEGQAAAGRQGLTEGQQSGRGVGQGLRAGYYGDQPADLRLEDILDTLDKPAQNETPEQRTARERMVNELTRGNGRPTPEMIEYVRGRRASSTATPMQTPQVIGRTGQTQQAEQTVHRMLNTRRQPDRLDEVMDHLRRLYPRGIPSSTFLIESRVRDYLNTNPGVTPPASVSSEASTDIENLTPPGVTTQMKSDDGGGTQNNLLTNLSSGRSAEKAYDKDASKSVYKEKSSDPGKSQDYISTLLGMLSGTEFREIKFEADTFEFDGRVSLSSAEASLISPTAFVSRGQYESESPGGGEQSFSSGSAGGGGGQSSPSAPPSRSSFQQGAVASRSSSAASPVGASTATPAISGGFEGGGGDEGSISQIIQSGPGFNLVQYDDGRIERRTGSRNWRNNNPGNLEFGDFARRYGAIGSDGRFAIFPTYEAGKRAKEALLFEGRGYAGMTIAQAITRYAPPNENDTAMYIRTAAAAAGVSPNTLMSDLNAEQRQALLAAMERVEGFRVGRVEVVQPGTAVAAAQPPAVGDGVGLGAESAGMTAADQAQAMGAGRQIVVQLPPGGTTGSQGSSSVKVSGGSTAEVSLNRRLEGQVS